VGDGGGAAADLGKLAVFPRPSSRCGQVRDAARTRCTPHSLADVPVTPVGGTAADREERGGTCHCGRRGPGLRGPRPRSGRTVGPARCMIPIPNIYASWPGLRDQDRASGRVRGHCLAGCPVAGSAPGGGGQGPAVAGGPRPTSSWFDPPGAGSMSEAARLQLNI
jgi:hypothetical protein